MLSEITLGQYFPGNSFIHRLDPRTKILATLIYIIAIFLADTPLAYGILIGFAALVVAVGCGNNQEQQSNPQANQTEDPSVSVQQVFVQDVPQDATYTSTVQAYVKNNIVPQTAGRIVKINVEVGDNVRKGQVLAEIDKVQLQQAQLEQTLGHDFTE